VTNLDLEWEMRLEERTDDVRAVMDAAGSERAIIYGTSEGGPMAVLFAAQHPERVLGLILCATAAKFGAAPDNPDGIQPDAARDLVDGMARLWGTGRAYGVVAQHEPGDARNTELLAQFERSSCTPQMVRQIMARNLEMDVRPLLPTISVPTPW
jgi:pimeloyl-ACP methyl ester carboxylesterase